MDSEESDQGNSWPSLVEFGIVPDTHCKLIEALQDVHDDSEPEEWEDGLKTIAEGYGLTY